MERSWCSENRAKEGLRRVRYVLGKLMRPRLSVRAVTSTATSSSAAIGAERENGRRVQMKRREMGMVSCMAKADLWLDDCRLDETEKGDVQGGNLIRVALSDLPN